MIQISSKDVKIIGHEFMDMSILDELKYCMCGFLKTLEMNVFNKCFYVLKKYLHLSKWYGCVGKTTMIKRESNIENICEFFSKLKVKLALITTYNPEANNKSERGYSPIM